MQWCGQEQSHWEGDNYQRPERKGSQMCYYLENKKCPKRGECSNVLSGRKCRISRNAKKVNVIEVGRVKDSVTKGKCGEIDLHQLQKALGLMWRLYFYLKSKEKPLMGEHGGNGIPKIIYCDLLHISYSYISRIKDHLSYNFSQTY